MPLQISIRSVYELQTDQQRESQRNEQFVIFTARRYAERGICYASSQLSAGYCHFGFVSVSRVSVCPRYKQIDVWFSPLAGFLLLLLKPHVISAIIHVTTFTIQRHTKEVCYTCIDSVPSRKLGPARTRPEFRPSVRLSVCLSVTRVICTKAAKGIIEILSRSDRAIVLVFRHQGSLRKSDACIPNGDADAENKGQRFSTMRRLYIGDGNRYSHIYCGRRIQSRMCSNEQCRFR